VMQSIKYSVCSDVIMTSL